MKAPRIGWRRTMAVTIVAVVIIYVFIAALLGGLNRDSAWERLLAIILAGVLFGSAMLFALGPSRYGSGIALAVLVVWFAWDVVTAPDAIRSTAAWWIGLAFAAGLGWTEEGPQ